MFGGRFRNQNDINRVLAPAVVMNKLKRSDANTITVKDRKHTNNEQGC